MACSTWHTSPARCRAGLSTSRASPSGVSVSNHPTASSDRFVTCPVSVAGFPLIAGLGFAFPSEARQSARPNRVRVTTDCPFAFRCSPHHLALTQLRSATGRKQVFLKGTCTSLMLHACGRTMAGTGPAMTVTAGYIQGGSAGRPVWNSQMTAKARRRSHANWPVLPNPSSETLDRLQ